MQISKYSRQKLRDQELKTTDPEEWRRRQDLKNENARKRYQEKKESNPEEWRRRRDLKNERKKQEKRRV